MPCFSAFPPNSLFQCPFTTRLSSSFPGDFLPFWPELAVNFTLGPPAHFLPSHRAGSLFLGLVQSSAFLVCSLAWQELSYGFLKIEDGHQQETGDSRTQFWFLGRLLPSELLPQDLSPPSRCRYYFPCRMSCLPHLLPRFKETFPKLTNQEGAHRRQLSSSNARLKTSLFHPHVAQ